MPANPQESVKADGDVVFTSADDAQARALRRQVDAGTARRIYAGVFTLNTESPLDALVLRNWPAIVSHLLPGAVLAYRSAIDRRPADGVLYVRRGTRRRSIELPGLRIEVFPGEAIRQPAEIADVPYKAIFMPTEARGFVENMAGGRGAAARTLAQEDLESRLERILTIRGDFKLNDMRDHARSIAEQLEMPAEGKRLDKLIGALLGTHEANMLKSKVALARAAGHPYDPDRVALFDALYAALTDAVFAHPANPAVSGVALENFAFFESYFSNFIEGTTFEVSEAEQIVFQGAIIPNRSEDSHDILGTFRAASSAPWRNQPAKNADSFLDWLKSVNALVLQARPDQLPGQWKERPNRAGNTFFVQPEQVPATLGEGFERISALTDPVARALMTMFVVSEVHPFKDGNGRTARLAMNCVLSEANLCRILVPTSYREDYLLPLKRLSNDREADAFIRGMARIHDWTSRFDYGAPLHDLEAHLNRCNAFREDTENYRLTFP